MENGMLRLRRTLGEAERKELIDPRFNSYKLLLIFNFLYKEIADFIIFGIRVLRLLNTLCRRLLL
jgi:hypothetical protein